MHNSIQNWAANGNIDSLPDITIAVGSVQQAVKFMAHKFVLSSCSGYFKALFASYDGVETHITNIGSHTFAFLLSFMYTGHLELNPLNVYEMLEASNWLQMAEALELCQQYLAHKHYYTLSLLQSSSSVVKPIPRRSIVVSSFDDQESHRVLKYQPLRLHNDSDSSSCFKQVCTVHVGTRIEPLVCNESNSVLKSAPIEAPFQPPNVTGSVSAVKGEDRNPDGRIQMSISKTENHFKASDGANKVVLDIACCDGPIKFHRVINEYYDPQKAMAASAKEEVAASVKTTSYHKCNQHIISNEVEFRLGFSGCQCPNVSATYCPADHSMVSTVPNFDKYKKKIENLQSYSCKICGSKFPSYYFVHKHRKLHHQDTKEFIE